MYTNRMRIKDSGRSWLLLVITTFSMLLELGTIKALSVLLPSMKEQLKTEAWIVGSSIAVIQGFGYTFGLFSDALVDKFGARTCVLMSGLIASIGLIICSVASSPLTLLPGLICCGFLLLQETILQGLVPEYFERYFEFAVGVYSSGAALGIVILPLVTQIFLETYGWRGSLLLLSGILFHSVPFNALINLKQSEEVEYNRLFDLTETTSHEKQEKMVHTTKNIFKTCGVSLLTQKAFVTRVFIPGLVLGYTLTGYLIYMVSFAISKGTSLREATIVVTCGGIGMLTVRIIGIHILHKLLTYKQILCITSAHMALFLSLMNIFTSFKSLSILSVLYGAAVGIYGTEVFISATYNAEESENFLAIGLRNLAEGIGSLTAGFVTGFFFGLIGSFTVSFNIMAAASVSCMISLGVGEVIAN